MGIVKNLWLFIFSIIFHWENGFIPIFDRYGKLIYQINPQNQVWDGTFNGSPLPSSDYWFQFQLDDGKIIKGHFSLKR
jgi:gliding motility-associated-like protein